MPTKRTPQLPAERHARKANSKPVATLITEKRTRKRELTRVQAIIADTVSEMLTHGSQPDAMETLVAAAAEHYARTIFNPANDQQGEEFEPLVRNMRANIEPEWRFELEAARRANQRSPEPERIEPTDISSRIRELFRDRAIDRFSDFLAQAIPEEKQLMIEILEIWGSGHHAPHFGSDEIALAKAFQNAIGHETTYINVPERMLDKVQRYVDALREVEGEVA